MKRDDVLCAGSFPAERCPADAEYGHTRTTASAGSGSAECLEELALPLLDSLLHFAQWLTRNREDAEDLVQEAYLKAHRAFHRFRPGSDFRAWMFTIVRNTFFTDRSSSRVRLSVPLDEPQRPITPCITVTPETLSLSASNRRRIHHALQQLPAHYRQVIMLSDLEELKYREIADILKVPIGTVMSRLARGRKLLRDELNRELVPSVGTAPRGEPSAWHTEDQEGDEVQTL